MAVDMFIKIGDVKGESVDATHGGEIDVLSWSWGMNQSGYAHVATGQGAGKVSVHDLTITKYTDKASPTLMQKCCDGSHFSEALLTIRKAGGPSPVEYLKVKMTDLIVTSHQLGAAAGGDRVTETVTLNFAKVVVEYAPQKADGTPDASVVYGWDIAANTATS